jgi:hypothetical protein
MVRLWDPATGKERLSTAGHGAIVAALRVSPDGKTLWSWARNATLIRWNLTTGESSRLLGGSLTAPLDPAALAAEGRIVAIGERTGGRIHLWQTDGKQLADLGVHGKRVVGIAFSPDGKLVATGGQDGLIRLWDFPARKEIRRMEAPQEMWGQLTFSPDGRTLAAAPNGLGVAMQPGNSEPLLFDVATGKKVVRFKSVPPGAGPLVFSPDGRTLAACGGFEDTKDYLVDIVSGKELGRCVGHRRGAACATFSPDSRFLVTGGQEQDDTIRLWELVTCREIACLRGHHSGVFSLAFTPDSRTLISGGGDATILLWDMTRIAASGNRRSRPLSPAQLDQCWKELAGDDAATAYRSVWDLAGDPDRSVPFVSQQLRPVEPADPARLARLMAELDADAFGDRERAATEIAKLGDAAGPALRKLSNGPASAEVRKHAQALLDYLNSSPEWLRSRRAIAALEYSATPRAQEVLEALARGFAEARLTGEARAALVRLKARATNGP